MLFRSTLRPRFLWRLDPISFSKGEKEMGSKSPVLRKTKKQNAAKKCKKKVARFCRLPSRMLALPIFPASHPASIFGGHELNFCVRDGNRWTLMPINTNYELGKDKDLRDSRSLCWHYLFSRPVTRQVFSANMSLTSVFGMGTGGPSCQSTPTIYLLTAKAENNFMKRTNSKEW